MPHTQMELCSFKERNDNKRSCQENPQNGTQFGNFSVIGSRISMSDTALQQLPWQLPNFVYGAGVVALHQEIEHFYAYILPTPTEFKMRSIAVKRIEEVVLSIWPGANVEVFGSFRSGLNLPVSDIDIVVMGCWHETPLYKLESELIARGMTLVDSVSVLDKASVPVVKFTERESQIKFDIAFNVTTGVEAAELIKGFKLKFDEMPKLVMVLKHFLTLQGLNEVYTGGISSYGLTLMCISFLQQQSREEKKYKNDSKLGMLLLKFLDFYGRKFDYFKYVISVRGESSYVEKRHLQATLGEYKWQSVLSIEDPITPTNDIGRSSYAALYVKQVFEKAFLKLSKLVDSDSAKIVGTILGCILEVPQEVINYREWVHYNFQHLTRRRNCHYRVSSTMNSFERRCYEYGFSFKHDNGLEFALPSYENAATSEYEHKQEETPHLACNGNVAALDKEARVPLSENRIGF